MAAIREPLVTLLTDFGRRDPYVAAMKGVLLSLCPRANIVDISHEVPPHDVMAGAFVLLHAASYFPPETLHVVVVDPGVGTDRAILAARFGGQRFLFPDNGVIGMVAERMPLEAMALVRNVAPASGAPASLTFEGRDVFAPTAAALLNGLDMRRLGPMPSKYRMLDLVPPAFDKDRVAGKVIYVDVFGNLITNISQAGVLERWGEGSRVIVSCAGREVGQIGGTYGQAEPGVPLALFNSMGLLEVAVNMGRAANVFGAGVGAEVVVHARGEQPLQGETYRG